LAFFISFATSRPLEVPIGASTMLRPIYVGLSVAGLILPVVCFGIHFSRGSDEAWSQFFAAPFATWVISGFSWDLILTAIACTLWMASESKRLAMRGFVWHFLLIFLVGICFALPTFLYRREGILRAQERLPPDSSV
jgi:mannose/fructose/N-acetylgalactosamine-specific phosphotransferase system component IIC